MLESNGAWFHPDIVIHADEQGDISIKSASSQSDRRSFVRIPLALMPRQQNFSFALDKETLQCTPLNQNMDALQADIMAQIVATYNTCEKISNWLKKSPLFRESVRDFMVNQQFRRDYWVKGARRLNPLEQAEALRSQKVMLIKHREDVSLKVTGSLGEASMNESVYVPVLDLLADYRPKTLGWLEQTLKEKEITFPQIVQAVMVLTGAGHVCAVQDDGIANKAKKTSRALNTHLMTKSRSSSDISYLAAPVTGGGVAVGRFEQLFLLALSQGKKQPGEWAQFVWGILQAQGQRLVKEGKTLETDEQNLGELTEKAQMFGEKQVPVLQALGVV
jgi:hypothetical protein